MIAYLLIRPSTAVEQGGEEVKEELEEEEVGVPFYLCTGEKAFFTAYSGGGIDSGGLVNDKAEKRGT
ncbi:hypothetical protein Trydic_g3770 [Trypoxylus dichotomus]